MKINVEKLLNTPLGEVDGADLMYFTAATMYRNDLTRADVSFDKDNELIEVGVLMSDKSKINAAESFLKVLDEHGEEALNEILTVLNKYANKEVSNE